MGEGREDSENKRFFPIYRGIRKPHPFLTIIRAGRLALGAARLLASRARVRARETLARLTVRARKAFGGRAHIGAASPRHWLRSGEDQGQRIVLKVTVAVPFN